jgi:DUF971 family protein
MEITPLEIRRVDSRELHITWADGHQSIFTNVFLREHCHCAACVHELTGKKMIKPDSIPWNIRIDQISLVGRYGATFHWSDGHSTGIYSFEKLREWCQCGECRATSP